MSKFFGKIKQFFIGGEGHSKNFTRYLIIVVAFLAFLFFTNDFDLIDVQKTAIVTAVGIDREGEDFSITAQISLPSASEGESGPKTVNVVAKARTVASALDQVNEKTGWYPKLVFCRLILLGESATQRDVFDGLDYFLRDEYITDNCLVAACEGKAETLLQTKTPIETASALAIEKVLSGHAERLGTSLPNTLRGFAASYYGTSQSGFLPLVKAEPLAQKEQNQATPTQATQGQSNPKNSQKGGGESNQEEKAFSATQTALFVAGKMVGTLDRRGTFALAAIKNELRLASYSLEMDGKTYTTTIKRLSPSVKLVQKATALQVELQATIGLADVSKSLPLQESADAGDLPKKLIGAFRDRLQTDVKALFEKCRKLGFDAFDGIDKLQKYESALFADKKDTLLDDLTLSVHVKVRTIR